MKKYELPALPYAFDALEPHYSARVLELHHGKHHAAYVKGANKTLEKLTEARAQGDFGTIAQLEKDLAFHVSGHVLHSLFWKTLSPEGGGGPRGELAKALQRDFGSFRAFKEQMTHVANAMQGSGWALLSFEPLAEMLTIQQVHDHQSNIAQGSVPLLALDMWEHAYYLQYQTAKADYVKAYWNIVNWSDVAVRYESVLAVDLSL